jgi:GR25 family glycosyltransferase involved in LPS biosynthesis
LLLEYYASRDEDAVVAEGLATNASLQDLAQSAMHQDPIQIICISIPQRVPYMTRLLSDLTARAAPGEFQVTFVPAVSTVADPRVAGWANTTTYLAQGVQYFSTLSHTLAMGIASLRVLPSVVIEDDVMLHRHFHDVVHALIRRTRLKNVTVIQLGFILRDKTFESNRFGDLLRPSSIVSCMYARHGVSASAAVARLPTLDRRCPAMPRLSVFALGLSAERNPYGAQAYIVTPGHARAVWDRRFAEMSDGTSHVERRIIGSTARTFRPLRVVPPLVLELPSRFNSSLQHNHSRSNEVLSRLTDNYRDYYCPPHFSAASSKSSATNCIVVNA